jgi:glycerophosphoryl diester phosphodiesterase
MRGITRRQLGALALAAGLAPSMAFADAPTPLIVAEGGAAAERPEDTRSAYDQAINEGADFLQATLAPTKEGVLVARRGNELSASTDVAAHPEFAARKTSKTVDGVSVTGWFTEDFTLAELKTLFCREARPDLHPQNTRYDGKEPILTLQEVLQVARDGCVRTARVIGVMPRLFSVGYFAGLGLPVDERLAQELNLAGYNSEAAAVWIQAYEPDTLRSLAKLTRARRMQLIDVAMPPSAGVDTAQMITRDGLTAIQAYAHGIAPAQELVIDPAGAAFPTLTTLVMDAHAAGLTVHSHTARAENVFLPRLLQHGDPRSPSFPMRRGDVDKLMVALFSAGVDSLSTDVPGRASQARDTAIQQIGQGRPS